MCVCVCVCVCFKQDRAIFLIIITPTVAKSPLRKPMSNIRIERHGLL